MNLDSSAALSRRDIVRIAQRFNAGFGRGQGCVPKGRLNQHREDSGSAVPSGLSHLTTEFPALKRRAITNPPSGRMSAIRLPCFT